MVFSFFKGLKFAAEVRKLVEGHVGYDEAARIFDLDWVVASMDVLRNDNWTPDAVAVFVLTRIKYEPKNYDEILLHKEFNLLLDTNGVNWRELNSELYWKLVGLVIKTEKPEAVLEWFMEFTYQSAASSLSTTDYMKRFRQEFNSLMRETFGSDFI